MPVENISTLAKDAFGDPSVIPLWLGEGDLPTPKLASDAVAAALAAGHVFYTYQQGIPELRNTLAEYLTDLHGSAVAADRITVTAGGMGAITLAVTMLVEPGDNVLVIEPVWPNIGGAVRVAGGIPRPVAMDYSKDGWQLDVAKLESYCDHRTKAVFFASPGNPTGAMIPLETQRALLEVCRRRGIWIVADEVYNRMVFGRRSAPSIAQIAHPDDRVLIINSFSKSWAMTGWRLGWLVHPAPLGALLANLTQYSNSGLPTFLQHAAITVVRDGEPFVERVNRYSAHGMQLVCDALDQMPHVRVGARPSAGMYVFFQVDGMDDSRAAARAILAQTRIGLAPGAFFGQGSQRFLRLCCCRSPDQLATALARLRVFFDTP